MALHNAAERGAEAVLETCENLFLEPGGQFWFDLQHGAWQAARDLDRPEIADYLAGQMRWLIARWPQVPALHFEDGTPFAQPATRTWLENLYHSAGGNDAPAADEWQRDFATCLDQCRQQAARGDLAGALEALAAWPVQNDRQAMLQRLASARLCLGNGRGELALPLLEEMDAESQQRRLERWDKALAFDIAALYLEAVEALQTRATAAEKPDLQRRAEQLRARICRCDLAAAVRRLPPSSTGSKHLR